MACLFTEQTSTDEEKSYWNLLKVCCRIFWQARKELGEYSKTKMLVLLDVIAVCIVPKRSEFRSQTGVFCMEFACSLFTCLDSVYGCLSCVSLCFPATDLTLARLYHAIHCCRWNQTETAHFLFIHPSIHTPGVLRFGIGKLYKKYTAISKWINVFIFIEQSIQEMMLTHKPRKYAKVTGASSASELESIFWVQVFF